MTSHWDDRESGQKKRIPTEIFVYDSHVVGRQLLRTKQVSDGRSYTRTGTAGFGHTHPGRGEDYSDQGITDQEIPF